MAVTRRKGFDRVVSPADPHTYRTRVMGGEEEGWNHDNSDGSNIPDVVPRIEVAEHLCGILAKQMAHGVSKEVCWEIFSKYYDEVLSKHQVDGQMKLAQFYNKCGDGEICKEDFQRFGLSWITVVEMATFDLSEAYENLGMIDKARVKESGAYGKLKDLQYEIKRIMDVE